jgi:hypothetical protein
MATRPAVQSDSISTLRLRSGVQQIPPASATLGVGMTSFERRNEELCRSR